MRYAVLGLVMVTGCYRQADVSAVSPPPQPATKHTFGPELSCPPPGTMKFRGVDPTKGGYLVLEHDGELEAARNAMAAGVPDESPDDQVRTMTALSAAFADFRPEIEECMVEADGAHPALQYQVGMSITGNSVATMISDITVQRIDGGTSSNSPVLASTNAEACIRDLLMRIELPPGRMFISGKTIFRQDFCTPTVEIARGMTQSYVAVYLNWWKQHVAQKCPAGIAELAKQRGDLQLRDPWQEPYVMRCNAHGFQVISAGPDRTLGTADDLESHR